MIEDSGHCASGLAEAREHAEEGRGRCGWSGGLESYPQAMGSHRFLNRAVQGLKVFF